MRFTRPVDTIITKFDVCLYYRFALEQNQKEPKKNFSCMRDEDPLLYSSKMLTVKVFVFIKSFYTAQKMQSLKGPTDEQTGKKIT